MFLMDMPRFLLPVCRDNMTGLLERAKELRGRTAVTVKDIDEAPNYHRVGQASLQRCGTCRFFTAAFQCTKYDFKASPQFTCDSWRPDIEALKKGRMGETTKEVSASATAVYAHGPGGLLSPAGLSGRKHGVVSAAVTPNTGKPKRKKKRKEWVATAKPGDKYRSIKNPKVYERLIAKGYSKSSAAAISNAMAKRGKQKKEGTAVTTKTQANNIRNIVEAKIHRAYTTALDELFLRGYMERDERLAVAGMIGDLLKQFGEKLDETIGKKPVNADAVAWIASEKETAVSPLEYAIALKHASHNQASHGFRFGRTPSLEQARRYRKAGVLQEYSKRSRERSGTKPAKQRNTEKPKAPPRHEVDGETKLGRDAIERSKHGATKGLPLRREQAVNKGGYRVATIRQRYDNGKSGDISVTAPYHPNIVLRSFSAGEIAKARKYALDFARTINFEDEIPGLSENKEQKTQPATFTVFKDKTGRYRWVAISSTAYRDRDGEIVSTKALADDVAHADATGEYGTLRWWHVPGLDLGDCDFNMLYGRSLIESGTFKNDRIAERVKEKAHLLKLSLGFRHPADEPDKSGVFHTIRRFERSLIPPEGNASNMFTRLSVTG